MNREQELAGVVHGSLPVATCRKSVRAATDRLVESATAETRSAAAIAEACAGVMLVLASVLSSRGVATDTVDACNALAATVQGCRDMTDRALLLGDDGMLSQAACMIEQQVRGFCELTGLPYDDVLTATATGASVEEVLKLHGVVAAANTEEGVTGHGHDQGAPAGAEGEAGGDPDAGRGVGGDGEPGRLH